MDCPTSSLSWETSTHGAWQRKLDEIEVFWARFARAFDSQGRKAFTITGHATLRLDRKTTPRSKSTDLNTALQRAWCQVRQDHPSIASHVTYDFSTMQFTRIYNTIRTDRDRDAWLQATFLEVPYSQSGRDFVNSDPPAPELPTIFIITPPSLEKDVECREIVFRAPHETIDGIGTLLLLGNYLKHASDALEHGKEYSYPEFNGTEVKNLSPPYRLAAKIPDKLGPLLKSKSDQIFRDHVFAADRAEHKEYLSLPFNQGAMVPGRHQRTGISINQEDTALLLAACKRARVTVTHAFNAAIPFVLRVLNSSSEARELYYRCDLLRNLRPFCAGPFSSSKHPVTAYHVGSTTGFETKIIMQARREDLQMEYHRVLREVQSFYQRVASDLDHPYLAPSVWNFWLNTRPKLEKTPPPGPPPSLCPNVSLSSLGRVDDLLPSKAGVLDVSDPWITGEEMGNGYGLFLTSYQGEIGLTAAYNDAWHSEGEVQQFLELYVQMIRTFLTIDQQEYNGQN